MLSLLVSPKVITLSGFYCSTKNYKKKLFSETDFCDYGDDEEDPDDDDDDDDEVVDDVDEEEGGRSFNDVTDRVPGSSEFFHFPPPPTLLVRPTPGFLLMRMINLAKNYRRTVASFSYTV